MKANNNFNKKIYEAVLANQETNKTPDETEQEPSEGKNPTENQPEQEPSEDKNPESQPEQETQPESQQGDSLLKEEE